jgi:starvation-inducible DNA-binding protein
MKIKEKEIISSLEVLLADLRVHHHNLRNFHWTVSGPQFYELHKKFEQLYDQTNELIDDVAERLLALDYNPVVSSMEILNRASLEEQNNRLSAEEMIRKVIDEHLILIKDVKSILKQAEVGEDTGTEDLLAPLVKDWEKENWMLKAYLA